MRGLESIVMAHPIFAGLEAALGETIAGCARNLRFDAGSYLFRSGHDAEEFFLIRQGMVALELQPPGRAPLVLGTEQVGDIVGTSWLVPPYRWRTDARAVELTRVIGINAACLRAKCDSDHHLGYEVMKRFLPLLSQRLDDARLQLVDVYGPRRA